MEEICRLVHEEFEYYSCVSIAPSGNTRLKFIDDSLVTLDKNIEIYVYRKYLSMYVRGMNNQYIDFEQTRNLQIITYNELLAALTELYDLLTTQIFL